MNHSNHLFHIPVMGLAFTVDSPIKVARFGISSVISIVEDRLIEMMRKHYYPIAEMEYYPITTHEEDYRSKRITDYLNLVNKIVQKQIEKLKQSPFDPETEIVKYFEMLPEESSTKQYYLKMLLTKNSAMRREMESFLRTQIKAGAIDVNIMTKIDNNRHNKIGQLIENNSDAVAALRGYAKSDLTNSSVVFSAGLNPRLYNYLEACKEFDADDNGNFEKKIIIKVSDYRSAIIQGKYLAKKGIWVSEFRIESGLNCGGHAFATEGYLMGPILEEFKSKKQDLLETLLEIYNAALKKKGSAPLSSPPSIRLSAQGGIGTYEEDRFLHNHYNIESTGWGTPFLLVPEATTVDEETLKLLCSAEHKDVVLSHVSPLGIRFHYLKGTSAEKEKLLRIKKGKPGSPCTEKYLTFNTEFTKEPICTASHKYQELKIAQLQLLQLPEQEYKRQLNSVLEKECLCIGLSNAATVCYKKPLIKKLDAVTICPGPNIANFSKVVSLQTMTDHIYGRKNIMTNPSRPHMFITELRLYVDYLKEELAEDLRLGQFSKRIKYYVSFYQNLIDGIRYYKQLNGTIGTSTEQFHLALKEAERDLDILVGQPAFN
jgi:hypothetical protein